MLLGAGAIGYGEAVPRGLDLAQLGAAVVGPVLSASRGGTPPPRLAHVNGGIVLDTGLQNRGVNNAIQQYGKLWEKLGCPVIVQVVESHPATLAKIAGKLAQVRGVQGIELLPPDRNRRRPAGDAGAHHRPRLRTAGMGQAAVGARRPPWRRLLARRAPWGWW